MNTTLNMDWLIVSALILSVVTPNNTLGAPNKRKRRVYGPHATGGTPREKAVLAR